MFSLKTGSLCPVCEKGKLKEIKKDLTFKYKNKKKKFQNETIFECDLCSHEILSQKVNRTIEKELTDFRRGIDGLLLGDQLKSIRKGLNLNKRQMAALLSVNEKTVGRYENGKLTQSKQIDNLYRIFQNIPSAANTLRPDISISSFGMHIIRIREKDDYTPELVGRYHIKSGEYFELKEAVNAAGY